jgi:hypothetical protein
VDEQTTSSEPNDEPERLEPSDPAQQFGAAAAEDAELADRLTDEADGDLDQAEDQFDAAARGPVSTETADRRE